MEQDTSKIHKIHTPPISNTQLPKPESYEAASFLTMEISPFK